MLVSLTLHLDLKESELLINIDQAPGAVEIIRAHSTTTSVGEAPPEDELGFRWLNFDPLAAAHTIGNGGFIADGAHVGDSSRRSCASSRRVGSIEAVKTAWDEEFAPRLWLLSRRELGLGYTLWGNSSGFYLIVFLIEGDKTVLAAADKQRGLFGRGIRWLEH